ncbi:hypothetical protein PUN28_008939 [Cardiocondyla obscurior]|uniref:Uncharacterized protein n=1 Tax=Cardiocondyla obscurior TaxID=286306 RepID=A0AAW2FV68_9HYME
MTQSQIKREREIRRREKERGREREREKTEPRLHMQEMRTRRSISPAAVKLTSAISILLREIYNLSRICFGKSCRIYESLARK